MADQDINERDALAALVESDGYQLFTAFIEQEWGADAYARKMDAVIVAAKEARESAEQDICELAAAARAVKLAASWPARRLAEVKAQQQAGVSGSFLRRRRIGS